MSTAPSQSAAIDTFNAQLAHAKLGALKLLQDLIASLTDPDAEVGQALRELRLAATAILRTRPLSEGRRGVGRQASDEEGRSGVGRQASVEEASSAADASSENSRACNSPPTPDASRLYASPQTPDASRLYASPSFRGNLNPTHRSARRDVRNLLREGDPCMMQLLHARRAAGPAP